MHYLLTWGIGFLVVGVTYVVLALLLAWLGKRSIEAKLRREQRRVAAQHTAAIQAWMERQGQRQSSGSGGR